MCEDYYLDEYFISEELFLMKTRPRLDSIKAFFEDISLMNYCEIYSSMFQALSYMKSTFHQKHVFLVESSWPGLQSIINRIVNTNPVYSKIVLRGDYINEHIVINNNKYLNNNSLLIASIPSLYGAMPVNIQVLMENYTTLIETNVIEKSFLKSIPRDFMLFNLRKILPLPNISIAILCSDKKLETITPPDLRQLDLIHRVIEIAGNRKLCILRNNITSNYIRSIINYIDAYTRPIPGSGYVVFRKCLKIPKYHKMVYGQMPCLYSILFSGLEKKCFIKQLINEVMSGLSYPRG